MILLSAQNISKTYMERRARERNSSRGTSGRQRMGAGQCLRRGDRHSGRGDGTGGVCGFADRHRGRITEKGGCPHKSKSPKRYRIASGICIRRRGSFRCQAAFLRLIQIHQMTAVEQLDPAVSELLRVTLQIFPCFIRKYLSALNVMFQPPCCKW